MTIVSGDQIDTLDEIQQFNAVVLSGSGYDTGHDCAVFDAVIPDYVEQGGGLVVTGWFYYFNSYGNAPGLMEVTPFEPSMNYVQNGVVELTEGHEIVDGLADWNNPSFDSNNGPIDMGATELSRNGVAIDGAVTTFGGGRVASLGPLFTAEYEAYTIQALHDGTLPDATEMFMRAIEWTASQQAPEGCHDGDLDVGEECDDGNYVNTDACVNPCVVASCGDGYTQMGVEPCDDGDEDNNDNCLVGCIAPSCGDGFVQAGVEACDDANVDNTDVCVGDMCQLASCGDGYVFAGFEECDDANDQAGDGCTACQLDSSESSSEGGESESSATQGGSEEASSSGGSEETTGGTAVDTSGPPTTTDGETGGESGGTTTSMDDTTGGIDPTDPSGSAVTDASLEDRVGGCGCTSDDRGTRGPWMLVLLLGLGVRRRR